jgi:hypothetical protein
MMELKRLFILISLSAQAGLLLLTACVSAPAGSPDLYSDAVSSRSTADAALQQAQAQELFLTATAQAPIIRITETAAGLVYQQQMWSATAQSVQGTQVSAMTQTAMAWTPTPNATQTAVFVMLAAEGTQIANNTERDKLALERQRDINDFKAKLPAYSFAIVVLVLAIVLMFVSRRERYRPIPVDTRGNPMPMLDVVEGTATDVDRNPNYRSDLRDDLVKQWLRRRLDLPPLLPEITAKRQDETTQRDQLLDLGTRGLPGGTQNQSAAKRLAGQEMTRQLSDSNLQSRFRILDEETSQLNAVNGEIDQVLDNDWEEAGKK